MSRNILLIALIIVMAWALVLVGSILIFQFIVPLPEVYPGGVLATAVLKAALATILALLWMGIVYGLVKLFLRRRLGAR